MGSIVKPKTWADAESLTYTDLNSSMDTIYNEFNGNIEDANIKASAAIAVTKIAGTAVNLATTQTISGQKTLRSPAFTGNVTGWIGAEDTWVYASASTFTIASLDVTAKYSKGTRLKFIQGGAVKYAVIVSSTFSTNTTVTIAVNNDYTIHNSAISSNYYSYEANPQGYPTYFSYTPVLSYSGGTTNPTTASAIGYFAIVGGQITVIMSLTVSDRGSGDRTIISGNTPVSNIFPITITGTQSMKDLYPAMTYNHSSMDSGGTTLNFAGSAGMNGNGYVTGTISYLF